MIELSRLRGSERYAACSDEVVALRLPWLVNNRNVPDAWIFSFQSALSCVALRKPNLHIPCGEIVLSPFNGHFSVKSQVSLKIFFCFFSDLCDCVEHTLLGNAVFSGIRNLAFPIDEAFVKNRKLCRCE